MEITARDRIEKKGMRMRFGILKKKRDRIKGPGKKDIRLRDTTVGQ